MIAADTAAYHKALGSSDRKLCELLAREIARTLPQAENKVWHGHPVWFLEGNPIVGYGKLKDCVRVLFWSGQSFQNAGLKPEGKFKAAEARYQSAAEVDKPLLGKWLQEAAQIQWDYKNIVKRKGRLLRVRAPGNTVPSARTSTTAIDAYIAKAPGSVQAKLQAVRAAIKRAAPMAEETIKYQIPTFVLGENLVHFAAFKSHIGFYPSPAAIEQFRAELSRYKGAKGSVQFPLDEPMPLPLIRKITAFRVKQAMQRTQAKKSSTQGKTA